MSHIIIEESGTCAPLPARNSWGMPLTTSRWNEPEPSQWPTAGSMTSGAARPRVSAAQVH